MIECYNKLIHSVLGGGNFAQAKLTQSLHVLTSRRILSYFYMIIVAFFMLSSTACSSDEETEKSEVFHYENTFLAHNWQISELYQRIGSLFIDVKEATLYCRFTSENIYFSETEEVNHFDDNGKVIQTTTETIPCGHYTYLIKENKIQIDNQIFNITDTHGSLVLQNEKWKLVLVEN